MKYPSAQFLVTAQGMRDLERIAMAQGQVTGRTLMERAGRAVVDEITAWAACKLAIVLCGPGNNGGDGYAIARLLLEQGADVQVYSWGDPATLPPDARANYDRWCALGTVTPLELTDLAELHKALVRGPMFQTFCVDSLFGIGLNRPLPEKLQRLFQMMSNPEADFAQGNFKPFWGVAVDVPSGLCADSGRALGAVFPADLTVTFHRYKTSHALAQGPQLCGDIRLADIGLAGPDRVSPKDQIQTIGLDQGKLVSLPPKQYGRGRHKYDYGSILVLTGGSGKTGAARLAATAALRIGAGVVTLGVPMDAWAEVAGQITDIMMCAIDTPEDLKRVLARDTRINTVLIGPGFGVGAKARDMIRVAQQAGRALVLDADALTSLVGHMDQLGDGERVVLTPHMGEFRRLFPDHHAAAVTQSASGGYSLIDAARDITGKAHTTLVIKDKNTIVSCVGLAKIYAPVSREFDTPWLSTAGAGDVLAGFVAGLIAQGVPPYEAAQTAVFLHAQCARHFGAGLIASDLAHALPQVLQALAAARKIS